MPVELSSAQVFAQFHIQDLLNDLFFCERALALQLGIPFSGNPQ